MKLNQIIKSERKKAHLSQLQLAAACGWETQSRVSNYEAGAREPSLEDIRKIEKALGVSIFSQLSEERYDNVTEMPHIAGKVPLISWVQAGEWNEAIDIYEPGYAEEWELKMGGGPNTYGLRVIGESMIAPEGSRHTFLPGEIIQVDPDQKSPNNGDFVIAKLNGHNQVTLKQYKIEDDIPYLKPLNLAFKPIFDQFSILGRIIGKIQKF